jgi:AcrR family transcriptional regulator
VRYGEEHKQATRRRIIETAGRRLKRDGIHGSGVTTLMADAGLTNGAFYTHFTSKDDLVAAAVADQLREQRASFSERAPGRAGVEQYVREYLSVQHRDNPGDGCPPPPCSTRSDAAPAQPSGHTPTACWPSSTTSPPAWRPATRPRHARRRSASSP